MEADDVQEKWEPIGDLSRWMGEKKVKVDAMQTGVIMRVDLSLLINFAVGDPRRGLW